MRGAPLVSKPSAGIIGVVLSSKGAFGGEGSIILPLLFLPGFENSLSGECDRDALSKQSFVVVDSHLGGDDDDVIVVHST